jgi:hypothetical protein
MATAIAWNPSGSREVRTTARPKWKGIRQGLSLAMLGYLGFVVLAVPCLVLALPRGGSIVELVGLDAEFASSLGWALVELGALGGYGLVLLGQWRCLVHAQQAHAAKDIQFACVLCGLLAPACFAASQYLGGADNYVLLGRGIGSLDDLRILAGGGVLQLVGVLIVLLNILLFTSFARAVRRSLGEPDGGVKAFLWAIAFLVGSTVGFLLNAQYLPSRNAWPVIGLCWLLCLVWLALLLRRTAQAVARFSRRASGVVPSVRALEPAGGQVTLRATSFLPGRGPRN